MLLYFTIQQSSSNVQNRLWLYLRQAHVTQVVCSCYGVLRQLRSIRRSLPRTALTTLVTSFIMSKVDYCNVVLAAFTTWIGPCAVGGQRGCSLVSRRSQVRPRNTAADGPSLATSVWASEVQAVRAHHRYYYYYYYKIIKLYYYYYYYYYYYLKM